MTQFVEETTLHFEDDTFKKLRTDADQVLQKLLANMAEKGSLEGKMTITVDVSFTEETVRNRDANIEGDTRVIHTPKFQHKVGSVLQIKNEQKGDMNCDGMEMVWDSEKGEYVLRPITGRDQMSIFDMEEQEDVYDDEIVEAEALEGRKIAALPEPSDEDDTPAEEDISDEFDDYDYQNPEEF
jgi:hypothetical protein